MMPLRDRIIAWTLASLVFVVLIVVAWAITVLLTNTFGTLPSLTAFVVLTVLSTGFNYLVMVGTRTR